ncbi:MAG: DNA alkylation repair protein [Ruminococcaceae bacterium]|nr:DNA alkylation repair protein [Oscillospiraceae bacterium]
MGETEYRDFQARLMPTVEKSKIIGIRTPILRKFAKSAENYEDFLISLPHEYYEENNLHAFLIERERDFEKCIMKLNAFLPYVDNWATCDSLKPPVLKKNTEKLLPHVMDWIASGKVYTVRYGINLLMSYYLGENFSTKYADIVAEVESKEYYINMMRAWYFATALAKNYDQVLPYLENNGLDMWTHNKTIQKAIESLRIRSDQKDYLRTLKR